MIWAAIDLATAGSIPYGASPMRASPLSLSRTRRYGDIAGFPFSLDDRTLYSSAVGRLRDRLRLRSGRTAAPGCSRRASRRPRGSRSSIETFGSRMKACSYKHTASAAFLRSPNSDSSSAHACSAPRSARDVTRVHRRDLHRDLARQRLEVRRAGDEVGLAVELDHRGDAATGVDVGLDHALERRAARASSRPWPGPVCLSISAAFLRSPPDSSSARLHSMMPAPVCSRSSLTREVVTTDRVFLPD